VKARAEKPFSPAITLCKMCRERCFWAKVDRASREVVLLERDPNPAGAFTFVRMEKRTPIVIFAYAAGAPEGSEAGPRYSAHSGRCPGPR